MKHVLVVGGASDPEAHAVVRELRARGAHPVMCDTSAFPREVHLSLRDGRVVLGRRELPPIASIYLRSLNCHPLTPELQNDLSSRPQGVLAQCNEKRAMLTSALLWMQRKGVPLINDFEANAQHGRKPYQLEMLRAGGLPAPRFLATNDPREARAFVRAVKQAVYKPLAGGATAREVTPADMSKERLERLANAPVLFQELVHGVAVRAYVVGRTVVAAAEIHSTELDYRRNEGEVVATSLRPDERRAVVHAARVCRMPFSGVDLIRGEDEFAVLECNPSPMFAVFEKKTGQAVARPLAALLVGSGKFSA